MKHTHYLRAKHQIQDVADQMNHIKTDKPERRMTLNNLLDALLREMSYLALREQISNKTYDLYYKWLTNYVITRHKK